jgi:hypothetical protein
LCGGITVGGYLSAAVVGPPDAAAFKAPLNLVLLGLVALPGLLRAVFPGSRILRFLGGAQLATALIVFSVAFALWMGLVPQLPPEAAGSEGLARLLDRLGLFGMTASTPFVFLYLTLLASLSASVAAGLRPLRPVFLLNHLGLFLALAGLGLGAPDRARHFMTVSEGHVEWRADGTGEVPLELPVAVRLDDFDMEEYPASLAVIDRATGTPLPAGRPAMFPLDGGGPSGALPGWELEIVEFLPKAAPVGGGAFARAVMKSAAQAALVRARPVGGGEVEEGWLSPGNAMVPPSYLVLGEDRVLVMTGPEPRRFISRVKVFTRDGREVEDEVEVNSPLTAGYWRVYQHGYDTNAGPMSVWSRFLLVEDPWRPVSRTGFVMWLLGSAGLVVSGRVSRKAPGGSPPPAPEVSRGTAAGDAAEGIPDCPNGPAASDAGAPDGIGGPGAADAGFPDGGKREA